MSKFTRKENDYTTVSTEDPEYILFEEQIIATKGIRSVTFGESDVTFHYPYSQTVKITVPAERMKAAKETLVNALGVFSLTEDIKPREVVGLSGSGTGHWKYIGKAKGEKQKTQHEIADEF